MMTLDDIPTQVEHPEEAMQICITVLSHYADPANYRDDAVMHGDARQGLDIEVLDRGQLAQKAIELAVNAKLVVRREDPDVTDLLRDDECKDC
jgi:hypothetical protein